MNVNSFLTHHRSPARLFIALAAVFALVQVPYAASGGRIPGLVEASTRLWLGTAVVFWVFRDIRTSRFHPSFEYDLFMFLAWPILLPHYLFRTRGRAGFALTAWLYLSLFAAVVLIAIVKVVFGHVVPE